MLVRVERVYPTKRLSSYAGRGTSATKQVSFVNCSVEGALFVTQDLGSLAPAMPHDSYTEAGEIAAAQLLEQEALRREGRHL